MKIRDDIPAQIVIEMYPEGNSKFSAEGSSEDLTALLTQGLASYYKALIERQSFTEIYATAMINAIAKIGLEKGKERV